MVPVGANGSPWTSLSAAKGRLKCDLPVPVVLLFEPKPPKPVPGCWLLFCPNPENDIVGEMAKMLESCLCVQEDWVIKIRN